MSAYLCSDPVFQLLGLLAVRFDVPAVRGLTSTEVAGVLKLANVASLRARYGDKAAELIGEVGEAGECMDSAGRRFASLPVADPPAWLDPWAATPVGGSSGSTAGERWEVAAQCIKTADCYRYQSCEVRDWRGSWAEVLTRQIRALVIGEQPEYKRAAWGAPSAPTLRHDGEAVLRPVRPPNGTASGNGAGAL